MNYSVKLSFVICFVFLLAGFVIPGEELTVEDIVKKNIEAAGGLKKLEAVKNVSFEIIINPSPTYRLVLTFYTDGNDKLKVVTGEAPIIQSVVLVNGTKLDRKAFFTEPELTEAQKTEYICYMKLFSGLFTVSNFRDNLVLQGLKKLGPEKHYVLTTTVNNMDVSINVDSETFMIKRMVVEDTKLTEGEYKATKDFYAPVKMEGFSLPNGWYESDIGGGASGYGAPFEMQNLKLNQEFPKDFFSSTRLNMGVVSASAGKLEGNVTTFLYAGERRMAIMYTNIQENEVKEAEFKENDALVLKFGETEVDTTYLPTTSSITAEHSVDGTAVVAKGGGVPFYVIVLFGDQFSVINDIYKPLMKITLSKK